MQPTRREKLFTGGLFSVERRFFEGPHGGAFSRDVVIHPGAVVILPLLDRDHLIMIRNFRYTVDAELWELPAGTLEPGETPEDTARRELEEETGYRAQLLRPLAEFFTSPGILTERMHAFEALDLSRVQRRPENNEQIAVEPLRIEDVRRRFLAGEFLDGKTIAALGLYFMRGPVARNDSA